MRAIHILSILVFLSAPHPTRVAPVTRPLAWLRRASESQPSSPEADLNWLFSNLPKSSAHASGVWHHSHPLLSMWDFYFDICEWHILTAPAHQHLRSTLHLTNPCAKRKVISLTKPKGKIYKTKSLGHYITERERERERERESKSNLCLQHNLIMLIFSILQVI